MLSFASFWVWWHCNKDGREGGCKYHLLPVVSLGAFGISAFCKLFFWSTEEDNFKLIIGRCCLQLLYIHLLQYLKLFYWLEKLIINQLFASICKNEISHLVKSCHLCNGAQRWKHYYHLLITLLGRHKCSNNRPTAFTDEILKDIPKVSPVSQPLIQTKDTTGIMVMQFIKQNWILCFLHMEGWIACWPKTFEISITL